MATTEQHTTPNPKILKPKPRPNCANSTPSLQHSTNYHRFRKAIHVFCVFVFFALPLSNLMRFDIPRQRFYFFGQELWISEFATIFFTLMFLLFVIVAMSMLYGRVYCGYLCPQMIFSEASIAAESKIKRLVTKYVDWSPRNRNILSRALFYLVVSLASIVLAFVFISYFVEPRDLIHRLFSLDIKTAGGIAGAVTTVLTLLDFLYLRQRFCTTVCPYGYLQGMLADGDTLLVQYRDETHECIECKKCVRVCHMGIDIRTSPYQIECIHCGECIDACVDVLGRLGKQGLIHYVWGEKGERLGQVDASRSLFYRLGFRNAKRVVVSLVVLAYGAAIFTAFAVRTTVLVQVSPDRSVLYRQTPDGTIYNTFRLNVANRGRQQTTVVLSIEDLPGARFLSFENAIVVGPEETKQVNFDIGASPSSPLAPGVNHFRIVSRTAKDKTDFDETFIMPFKASP
jgi:cytochrome c oxidase accessory protein FixG